MAIKRDKDGNVIVDPFDGSMRGFFDGHCRDCGAAISWAGSIGDCPPCPNCDSKSIAKDEVT